ncbi:hypothetical protein FOZ62_031459 [Perkinsus olseni]|uniref:Chitinase n=1 Tax=Perkinsus olseni TaxID=32597 RepID=A0A7J6T961_PEROL|nr:hypothetical protein FOZ62_031459 [Perkinsus olseni]
MWLIPLCLCALTSASSIGSLRPNTPSDSRLEFYKLVAYPWNIREVSSCFNPALCPPEANYTWDYYFDQLFDLDVKRFVMGGYSVTNSRIKVDPPFYHPWNKSGFSALKSRVESEGGKILAALEVYADNNFNKTAFAESVAEFTRDYPVDGFRVSYLPGFPIPPRKQILEAVNELGMTSALWFDPVGSTATFQPSDWEIVDKSGLGRVADINFVPLMPMNDEDITVFSTDRFAEKIIANATRAGINPHTLVLHIPLLAESIDGKNGVGYSNAIFDMRGDPQGDGSVANFRFFSQPRAIDKIELARKHGLRGIALQASYDMSADLYPWDRRSLCYALATNV